MRNTKLRGQAFWVYGKTMVLRGNKDALACEALHRMVGTVMTKLHLYGLCPCGKGQNLVAQANTK
jgi:hypothetical protein